MSLHSPVMAVIPENSDSNFANQIANSLGYPYADIIMGSPMNAAVALASREHSPAYIIIDIGTRTGEVISEIDQLAESCEAGTRVIVIGRINDIKFYRELTQLGVLEYFTHPADLQEVKASLMAGRGGDAGDGKKVVTFMSAASGDGSSTLAMNVAYSMANDFRKKVVLVDMDYQFGMVAKNLDLNTQFGIKEIFDHPDRGVDPTLVARMISPYGDNLSVIAAPEELKYLPDMNPETIRGLISTLTSEYDCVVIDLPHIWSSWTASAISASTDIVLVSQLWLRSITHAARLLGLWRNMGISDEMVKVAINRAGAKFKEGISDKDFERVCSHAINYSVPNDIKTIVAAESQGQMIMEVSQSALATQLKGLAGLLMGLSGESSSLKAADNSRFSLFKNKEDNMFGKKKNDGAIPEVPSAPAAPAQSQQPPMTPPPAPTPQAPSEQSAIPSAPPLPPAAPTSPPSAAPTPPPPSDAGANLPVNVMQPEETQQQTGGALVASQERMLAEQESLLEQRKKLAEAAQGRQSSYTDKNLETPDFIKAKQLILEELLEHLDFEEMEPLAESEKRSKINGDIEELIAKVSLPLTAAQHELLKKALLDDVLGFGPLEILLEDPEVSDIMVNGANQIYIEKSGKINLTDVKFVSERHLLNVIQKIVQRVGRRVDETSPMVDARMPDGSRFNAIIPPLALDGSLVSIRKFKQNKMPLSQYIDYGSATQEMVRFLEICSQIRMNILISGGTGSGKTTLLNALSGHIEEGERVITIEDAAELQMHQPHVLRLETRPPNMEGVGEVTQRALVKNALRMRPDRIILGEIRGEEVIDVLQAMNTGHDGSMATIHANNPRECLTRLENLFGLTGMNLPLSTLRNQIAGSLNMVVQISRMRDGSRKITQIEEIVGMEGDVIITQTLFHFKPTGMSEDGKLLGEFVCNGVKPRFMEQASYYGLDQEMAQTLTGSPGMM